MKLTLATAELLTALQMVIGAVERRQTMPILANVLLVTNDNQLLVIATDTEIELIGVVPLTQKVKFPAVTVAGRKLLDICRTLSADSTIALTLVAEREQVIITSGSSKFTLVTLAAAGFPKIPEQNYIIQLRVKQRILRKLAEKTYFVIPQQNARHFLLGMFLEIKDGVVRAAASDGHRLALYGIDAVTDKKSFAQVIVPRKGVIELIRLLEDADEEVLLALNENYIRVVGRNFAYTSKLIVGKFPNYAKLIPEGNNKVAIVNREFLKQAVNRVAVLSNEIFRNIRLQLQPNLLRLSSNNPEQEEAVEDVPVTYREPKLETIFNVNYFLDILNSLETENVQLLFKDNESGVVVEEAAGHNECVYVLMPIRK